MSAQPTKFLSQIVTESPSAVHEALPSVQLAPGPVPKPPPPRRGWLIGFIAALVLVAAVAAAVVLRGRRSQALGAAAISTVKVERRDFVRSLRLAGSLEAVRSHSILGPMLAGVATDMVITKLVSAGSRVKQGDLLAEFNRQPQIKNYLDKQADYRDLVNQIQEKEADQALARAHDETELKQAENALDKAKLEVSRNEVVSRIDAEKNLLALEEAEATLKQLRQTFELKRRAAEADKRILEIKRDVARSAVLHAQENSEKLTIRAPLDGLVVLNPIWKSGGMGEVLEGDQVWPGFPFMQVVDPATMEVRVRVNQLDLPYLRIGQSAKVRLDAYPDLVFPAKLEQLGAIKLGGALSPTVRSFAGVFSLQGHDPRMMPDLSAAVDVELERLPNALALPRDAVIAKRGKSMVLVKSALGFQERPVKVGPTNDLETVIESGVEAGEVVKRGDGPK